MVNRSGRTSGTETKSRRHRPRTDHTTKMGCEEGQREKKLEIYRSQESVQEKLDPTGDK
jgi:hypothetical protein